MSKVFVQTKVIEWEHEGDQLTLVIDFGGPTKIATHPMFEAPVRELVAKANRTENLEAEVLELRHALEHVVECGTCGDCVRLAQGALDGIGREDFRLF